MISVTIGDIETLVDIVIFVVLYLWCHLSQDASFTFFDYTAPAIYLPWIIVVLSSFVGPRTLAPVIGNLAGMLYIFLKFNLPQEIGGPDLLKTPKFL
jgi:derlin-1